MKTTLIRLTLSLFALVFAGELSAQYTNASADETIPLYTDEDIRMRLRSIASCVIPRYTDVVKSYIRTYTIKHRDKTERMLGKTVMYFPIFQKYAKEYGLPEALKYQIDCPDNGLRPLYEMEKEYIQRVLVHTKGNKTKAAQILQIDRKTLREKLK